MAEERLLQDIDFPKTWPTIRHDNRPMLHSNVGIQDLCPEVILHCKRRTHAPAVNVNRLS